MMCYGGAEPSAAAANLRTSVRSRPNGPKTRSTISACLVMYASVASRYCGAYGPRSNGAAQAQRISSGLGATTAVHEPAVSG
jgi:hypothetical protein